MQPWKRRLLIAAVPITVITAGCLAAQQDIDALAKDATNYRASCPNPLLTLQITEVGPGWDLNEWQAQAAADAAAFAKEATNECGSHPLDDVMIPAITKAQLGVVFGSDAEGTTDPCKIHIAQGAESLADTTVKLRAYDSNAPGELFMMSQRESADACEGQVGFYFVAGEAGENSSISLCPTSCDSIVSSAAEGGVIEVEMVIGQA